MESLQFELSQVSQNYYKNHQVSLQKTAVNQIRQDLAELDGHDFQELKEAFAPVFSDFWLSQDWSAEHRVTKLNSARLDFMNFQKFLPETAKTYFISASLDISERLSLPDLLGFEAYDYLNLTQEPIRGQKIWLDSSMPNIPDLSAQTYAQKIARRMLDLSQLKQPILVLFNAKKPMFDVSEKLEQAGLSHLCQHKNGSAANVKRRFDKGEAGILLGTGSFWEGVDFANQDSLIEVITRLPFDNPEDPFIKKINRQLREQGKHPFYDYSLPVTILRLKQAIGRSKRWEQQRSAVIILDKRILTKHYGSLIYQSLAQEFPLAEGKFSGILPELAHFFKNIWYNKKD